MYKYSGLQSRVHRLVEAHSIGATDLCTNIAAFSLGATDLCSNITALSLKATGLSCIPLQRPVVQEPQTYVQIQRPLVSDLCTNLFALSLGATKDCSSGTDCYHNQLCKVHHTLGLSSRPFQLWLCRHHYRALVPPCCTVAINKIDKLLRGYEVHQINSRSACGYYQPYLITQRHDLFL